MSLVKHKYIVITLIIAFLIRLTLVIYGNWQDSNLKVKYTDADYAVFTDAAREMIKENGSPFRRATYRYTPLLSFLMIPNVYFHQSFGKILFILGDLIIGWYSYKILLIRGISLKDARNLASVWLFHPFSINTSTRGNADSLVAMIIILSIFSLLQKKLIQSAILFGLAVHFKIYPIIYSFVFLMILDKHYIPAIKNEEKIIFQYMNKERILFFLFSAGTFLFLTLFFFYMYGMEFLYEGYFYHFIRRDNRHNFSVYFYDIYLSYDNNNGIIFGFLSFFPQFLCLYCISIRYGKDVLFSLFLLTYTFVTFNKVCTAQYFLWYIAYLPLILPSINLRKSKLILLTLLFLCGELNWLFWAYLLEMKGKNTFIQIWLAGILFFGINIFILCTFMKYYHFTPIFQRGKIIYYIQIKNLQQTKNK